MLKALMTKGPKLDHLPRQVDEIAFLYSKGKVVCNIKSKKEKVNSLAKADSRMAVYCSTR